MKQPTLISRRDGASPVSSWTEEMYLQRGDSRRWRLFVGGYAGLAEASDYMDPTSGEYELPAEIDGLSVVGIEDGIVVGGKPDWFNDEDTIEFDSLFEPSVRAWLKEKQWADTRSLALIERALLAAAESDCLRAD
ncbi:MAG: hypothetical protein O9284_05635 [Steroidobacteraceae bacterium]|nr:hypothetical protein [Steroidobacteraceae bacterium]